MEDILLTIQENLDYAPLAIFGLMLLAGFNLPVSEDAMLFLSGFLAAQNPEKLLPLFLGIYLGAYGSDLICYGLGRTLGPKLWEVRYFRRIVSPAKVETLRIFYQKNGLLTLLLGRFIPFGVRNGLFITAGLSKMNFLKFALYDWMATSVTCSIYFFLYYHFGTDVVEHVKKGNIIFFSFFLTAAIIYFFRKKILKRSE